MSGSTRAVRTRRGIAGLAALAVGAGLLAACAPIVDPDWVAPAWPVAADVRVAAPASPVELTADAALEASVIGVRLRDDALGVQARVAALPAVPAFTDAAISHVRAAVDAGQAATGHRFAPTPHPRGAGLGARGCVAGSTTASAASVLADPALGPVGGAGTAVVCDIVAARGPFVGQRVRVIAGSPTGIATDAASILYADVSTGEAVSAADLWLSGTAEALGADIVDALRRDAGALSLAPAMPGDEAQLAALQAALATSVPTPDGVAITIAAGFSAPELTALGVEATAEALTIEVPAEVAGPLLSPFGARLVAAAGAPFAGPPAVGVGWADCTLVPCVAVTYDDGPSAHTAPILEALAATDSAATFYALGSRAAGHVDLLARMTAQGHEVANHTWNHPHLPGLTPGQVSTQIRDTSRALTDASGQPIRSFRPPYGEYSAEVLAAAGLPAILWDVDTRDWQGPAVETLVERGADQAGAGSIVLLHDVHPVTQQATPGIIEGLRDRGFSLVTVSQLFGGAPPASGAWRRAG